MGSVTKPNTYTAGNTILASDVTDNEDTLYTLVNGNLDNANIDASAGIVESKIAFNTSTGHDHDGTNSKAIPKALVFTVTGTLTTGTSVAPILISTGSLTISKVYANAKTAPTGQALKVDINIGGTSIWDTNQANRLELAAGSSSGTQTSFDTTSLSEGDVITLDIDQVGSSAAGEDLTITIKT